jgi:hypothetical protein
VQWVGGFKDPSAQEPQDSSLNVKRNPEIYNNYRESSQNISTLDHILLTLMIQDYSKVAQIK